MDNIVLIIVQNVFQHYLVYFNIILNIKLSKSSNDIIHGLILSSYKYLNELPSPAKVQMTTKPKIRRSDNPRFK